MSVAARAQSKQMRVHGCSRSAAVDVPPYVGTLMIVINPGNGASGTALQPILCVGADSNASNANVVFATVTNFTNVAGQP